MGSGNLTVGYNGITVIESCTSGEGKSRLYDMIKESVTKENRTFLIVPEQQTVMAEAELTELLEPSSALVFEACNFTRFANTVFRSLGGVAGEYCNGAKKQLLMWRTVTELSSVLSMTRGRRDVSAGIVEKTMAAVSEMQSLGITAKMLEDAATQSHIHEDVRLHNKIKDLALVLARYKQLVKEKYSDTADDIALATQKIGENDNFLRGAHIYIEGFTSFTEPQYELIKLLAKRCSITVLLYISKSREESLEYAELKATRTRIFGIADLAAIPKRLYKFDINQNTKNPLLAELAKNIWATNYKIDNDSLQNLNSLRIFKAHTPYEEFDFLANDIKRRVALGDRFSDFAIVARDAKIYDGILDNVLKKADIPCFTSYKRDITAFEAIKLIFTAYSVIRYGFKREDVISYAKCGLCGIDADLRDEFELYCELWQISGKHFTDGADWNMNPSGYSITKAKGASEFLIRINEVKKRLIEPLVEFKQSVDGIKTVREHARGLLEFLLSIDLARELERAAEKLNAAGESESATESLKLWRVICDALDTLVEVLGDYPTDAEGFLSQFKVVISEADIGRIPAFCDEVTVGSADMLRLSGKKHIYLVGANAGEFPAGVSDNSYFSDKDRALLYSCGLTIEPDLEIKNARELFFFCRALSFAKESITVLYAEKTTSFKPQLPSDVIERIGYMTGGAVKPMSVSEIKPEDKLFSDELSFEYLSELNRVEYASLRGALSRLGKDERFNIADRDITNRDLSLGEEYSKRNETRNLALTQTRIDTFVSCPLSYFCKYQLALNDTKKAEFDSRNIGSFIHSILENFFKELRESGRSVSELTPEERYKLTERAAKGYLLEIGEGDLGSARFRITTERLCRAAIPVVDGLCDEFSGCKFTPAFFELGIGSSDPTSPKPTVFKTKDGMDVLIYGTIDRVDTYEKDGDVYVRVIDYKTGEKSFSPDDISLGKNLQMFVYLKSITDTENEEFKKSLGVSSDGKIIPAGVIYVKTSVKDEKIRHSSDEDAVSAAKRAQEREGMILDREDIINAMNTDYIPIKYKDGKIDEKSKKYLFSEERWGSMMGELEAVVTNVAERIKSGEIKAISAVSERSDKCDYCEFKPICRIKEL